MLRFSRFSEFDPLGVILCHPIGYMVKWGYLNLFIKVLYLNGFQLHVCVLNTNIEIQMYDRDSISHHLPIFGPYRVIITEIYCSRFSDLGPQRALFATRSVFFAPSLPNSQILPTLYPMKPFLKQLYQLVLNIYQFVGLIKES